LGPSRRGEFSNDGVDGTAGTTDYEHNPNVPPALLPGESGERLDDLPAEAEEIRAALLDTFDRQQQIDAAARLVARHVMLGHSPDALNSYKGFGPRQAHVAFRRIRRRAGSELLNGGAALILAASAITSGLSRSALNFDPAKAQVRR
jgi:hypothetical protein